LETTAEPPVKLGSVPDEVQRNVSPDEPNKEPELEPSLDSKRVPWREAMTGVIKPGREYQGESFQPPAPRRSNRIQDLLQVSIFLASLYAFFCSIDLMSGAFKLMGGGFAHNLMGMVDDPLAGLLIGVLATSLVQSSSSITSITVGLVAAGAVPFELGIPIVMGANIGTTVTNTIVSLGHVTQRAEFERAFAAGTVHDFFNIFAVLVLFPIEITFHPIQYCATEMADLFYGTAGISVMSPLKAIVKPTTHALTELIPHGVALLAIALSVLFLALSQMVKVMRKLIMTRVEGWFDRVLFRNDVSGFFLGWILTAIVQSSSATTSLLVPLVGSGVLTVRRIFTYTLGANLGTTITALLASFATGTDVGLKIALAHMTFNVFGIVLLYPLKFIPINLAIAVGKLAARSRRHSVMVIGTYLALYLLPVFYIFFR
jgi:solute carrier family 34 (sodium-dependent phosphate cotransporter)